MNVTVRRFAAALCALVGLLALYAAWLAWARGVGLRFE